MYDLLEGPSPIGVTLRPPWQLYNTQDQGRIDGARPTRACTPQGPGVGNRPSNACNMQERRLGIRLFNAACAILDLVLALLTCNGGVSIEWRNGNAAVRWGSPVHVAISALNGGMATLRPWLLVLGGWPSWVNSCPFFRCGGMSLACTEWRNGNVTIPSGRAGWLARLGKFVSFFSLRGDVSCMH